MTLVEAFLFFRLPCLDPALEEDNNRAGALLTEAARALGVVPPCTKTSILDLRQDVVISIGIRNGVRHASGRPWPDAPDSDVRVRGYIRNSLYHGCADWWQSQRALSSIDDDSEVTTAREPEPDAPNFVNGLERYQALQSRILDSYVRKQSILRQQAVDELRRIKNGQTTVDALIEGDPTSEGKSVKTLRNRRYGRYRETIRELHVMVDTDSSLAVDDRLWAHRIVDELRIYEAKAQGKAVHSRERRHE